MLIIIEINEILKIKKMNYQIKYLRIRNRIIIKKIKIKYLKKKKIINY